MPVVLETKPKYAYFHDLKTSKKDKIGASIMDTGTRYEPRRGGGVLTGMLGTGIGCCGQPSTQFDEKWEH